MMSQHSDIRFVYEEEQSAAHGEPLTPEAIKVLPDDMLAKFRRACLIADFKMAMHLTEQIRPEHSSLADSLSELLNDFQFDILQELFGKGEKNEHKTLC